MKSTNRRPRGRFAPTPSGELHIGNAWTALLAWLQIRSQDGSFVLRIEDTDTARSKPHLTRQIIEDLSWLGLDWDEGPDVGGPYGPYTQSERLDWYVDALQRLQDDGYLYPCYCSRADLLGAASAPHGIASEGPVYPGTCRRLTEAEQAARAKQKQPSLRFAIPGPPDRIITFEDGICGQQLFPATAGGDFIVKRADGIISYQLAVVVDDAMMEITDVIRGYDLLDSTPRQILLNEALGFATPSFSHVPLFMGPDGRRLAKRHGHTSLAALRAGGIKPQHVIGWLAWIGGLLQAPEACSVHDLIPSFQLDKLPTEPIVITEQSLSRLHSL